MWRALVIECNESFCGPTTASRSQNQMVRKGFRLSVSCRWTYWERCRPPKMMMDVTPAVRPSVFTVQRILWAWAKGNGGEVAKMVLTKSNPTVNSPKTPWQLVIQKGLEVSPDATRPTLALPLTYINCICEVRILTLFCISFRVSSEHCSVARSTALFLKWGCWNLSGHWNRTFKTAELRLSPTNRRIILTKRGSSRMSNSASHLLHQLTCSCDGTYICRKDRRISQRMSGHIPIWLAKSVSQNTMKMACGKQSRSTW